MSDETWSEINRIITLAKLDNDEVFALGVSGGADSLALALMLKEWADVHHKRVVALTVDHGLRPTSLQEAQYVAEVMLKNDIEHHILTWEGTKPISGIETTARLKRYELIEEWCLNNDIKALFIAHHLLDQVETFFMRLQRGSGIDGLCGIASVSQLGKMKILRPLLNVYPEKLKDYLLQKDIAWIEDESNKCEDFLRVKVRNFIPVLDEKLGIDAQRIADTMKVLRLSRDYLEEQTAKFIKNNVKFWDGAGVSLNQKSLTDLHEEMFYRVLCDLLKEVGNKYYAPRSEDVQRLMNKLKCTEFKGSTLGGCEFIVSRGKVWIVPELREKQVLPKKVWEEFIKTFPKYKKMAIPHKMRLSLLKINPIYS